MPGSFLNHGTMLGAAYQNDWESDLNRAAMNFNMMQQAKAIRDEKTKYYAEKLKKGHAHSPYNTKRLDKFYEGLNNELYDFLIKNPNFENSVQGQAEFNRISGQYLDNDIIKEDLMVQEQFRKLQEAAADPTYTQDEFEAEMEKYEAYNQGLTPDRPYMFHRFKQPSLKEILDQMDVTFDHSVSTQGNMIYNIKYVNLDHLRGQAIKMLTDPVYARSIQAGFEKAKGYYDNEIDYLMAMKRSSVPEGPSYAGQLPSGKGNGSGSGDMALFYNQHVQRQFNLGKTRVGDSKNSFQYLTEAGEVGNAIPSYNNVTPLKLWNPNLPQPGQMRGEEGSYETLKIPGQVYLSGTNAMIQKEDGTKKIVSEVSMPLSSIDDETQKRLINDFGFKKKKIPSIYAEKGIYMGTTNADPNLLVGQVELDAVHDPTNLSQYESAMGGKTQAKDVLGQLGQYSDLISQTHTINGLDYTNVTVPGGKAAISKFGTPIIKRMENGKPVYATKQGNRLIESYNINEFF